jgi:hypothetical protein
MKDDKRVLLAALRPTPRLHVNMQNSDILPVANFTCYGTHDEEHYDVHLLRSYVNEMIEMKRFLVYVVWDSVGSLIMWRGQVEFGKIHLPLHSLLAFFGGIHLVENLHQLPAFSFFFIAWGMIASCTNRQRHPSPWHRTNSFFYYLMVLLSKKGSPQKQTIISEMENHENALQFEKNWSNRISTDMDVAMKQLTLQDETDRIGNENFNTKQSQELDPLGKIYFKASWQSCTYILQNSHTFYLQTLQFSLLPALNRDCIQYR